LSDINSNRVELVDKITSRICVATYSGCCISFSLLITIFTLLQAEPPNKYLIIPMFSVVVIIGFLIFHYEKKLSRKFCKFNISDENIEIFIPPGPWFKISWSDINGVSTTRFSKRIRYTGHYVFELYPEITFSCKGQFLRTVKLRKFHSSYKREILKLLKDYSDKLNKIFFWITDYKRDIINLDKEF